MSAARLLLALAALPVLALSGPAAAEEQIRVRLDGDGGRIEELPLEDYVAGVISGEMPSSFPPEALKAQAVAARSYALTRRLEAQVNARKWDIGVGVLAQCYRHGQATRAAQAAAAATAGEVLVHGVEPVEAYFHAACGGRTEAGAAALGRDLPYLASVPCGHCDRAPGARWRVVFDGAALGQAARLGGAAQEVRIAERTATGRVARVAVAREGRVVTLTGAELRQRLGWSKLPSLAFELRADGRRWVFEGRGQGHGAGLCQWGAAGLARAGKDYREILAHYYPGAEVVRMY
ncbi:MAG: SpoIID/LytB domain-containing protein [Anaeromyxobacter sp.]